MAATTVKFALKGLVCGAALYTFADVLSSQDNSISNINLIARTTRENMPVNLPELPTSGSLRKQWNSGVQQTFQWLEEAPANAAGLASEGVTRIKTLIEDNDKP